MKAWYRISAVLLSLLLVLGTLTGCIDGGDHTTESNEEDTSGASSAVTLTIAGDKRRTMEIGQTLQLALTSDSHSTGVMWVTSNSIASVDDTGLVTALEAGKVTVTATVGVASDSILITVIDPNASGGNGGTGNEDTDNNGTSGNGGNQTPPNIELPNYEDKQSFYDHYSPALSYEDAKNRTEYGLMSGSLEVPELIPTNAGYRPMTDGKYIRNNEPWFVDSNTYVIVDSRGQEVMRIYRGGAYITLEEVAAYIYAFGEIPANYVASKKTDPDNSVWGEYLRLNHSKFNGNTDKYPYEPVLPNISGCGGTFQYYEMDIGTTDGRGYNNGHSIVRGAARLVYARYDINENGILEPNEKYVFYTYNHYNDFQEYLNYYGGWGERFGNITGGGTHDSDTDYNPTPYVPVVMASLKTATSEVTFYYFNPALQPLFLDNRRARIAA